MVQLTTDSISILLIFTQFQSACFKEMDVNSTSSTSYYYQNALVESILYSANVSFLVSQLSWNHSFRTNVIPEQHRASLYSPYYPE